MRPNILIFISLTIAILLKPLYPNKTINKSLNIISNSSTEVKHFFFTQDNKSFLVGLNNDNTYSVWHYSNDRKCMPIHNANKFDDFPLANKNFDSISINKSNETISFGNIVNTDSISLNVLESLSIIENKTIKIDWYFWNKNKNYFLFEKINNEISIWHYNNERKYIPIHNAKAMDGYNKALKNLENVAFNKDSGILNIGEKIFINNGESNNSNAFILKIKTNGTGLSGDSQYYISTDSNYKYDYDVDCNSDGIKEAENLSGGYTCRYEKIGTYNVSIEGIYPSRGISTNNDNGKILDIKQWGNIKWKNMSNAFADTHKMKISAKDEPNFSQVESMRFMFSKAKYFNQDISNWDVSNVKNMSAMFYNTISFNPNISNWNVSNATDMSHMFYGSNNFNQNISNWDVSNAKNMKSMFDNAKSFNQDISNWDVSNTWTMEYMFFGANSFNQNISSWNTSKVVNMGHMFSGAKSFNQNIGNWDVFNVLNMGNMFSNTDFFNQDLTKWKINPKAYTSDMFLKAKAMEEKNKPKIIAK